MVYAFVPMLRINVGAPNFPPMMGRNNIYKMMRRNNENKKWWIVELQITWSTGEKKVSRLILNVVQTLTDAVLITNILLKLIIVTKNSKCISSFNAINTKLGRDLQTDLTWCAISYLTDQNYGFHKNEDQKRNISREILRLNLNYYNPCALLIWVTLMVFAVKSGWTPYVTTWLKNKGFNSCTDVVLSSFS